MAELIAVGKGSQRQCRYSIEEGEETLLGRAPRSGWAVPWDRLISREHARIQLVDGRLHVVPLETARNPILLEGKPTEGFTLEPGQAFRIGETSFYLRGADESDEGDSVVAEHLFGGEVLTSERFTNPSSCLHALCQMPGLIGQSKNDAELAEHVVELLLDSVRGSLVSAVMQFESAQGAAPIEPALLRWNCRGEAVKRFQPSRRLIRRALERQQSVVHLWMDDEGEPDTNFTMNNDLDWAFCTPIPAGSNEQWCLYVSGKKRFAGMREVRSPQDLIGELRTAELIARFVGAVRQVRALEQQHIEMRRFFSPAVVEQLAGDPTAALEPRFGPVSVLFCDVRGFSRKVEASRDLHGLLAQVSHALSVMTRSILKYEGVIADFQGDAAMGFWGWPSAHDDAALLACRAALAIQGAFAAAELDPASPLHGFRVGIGIGHGDAIAGQIGSMEQIKVGVFGPVVNLSSRLQDLTKQVGVPILLDGATAEAARSVLPAEEGCIRCVGRLRPTGIESPVDVHALVAPCGAAAALSAAELRTHEAAVEALGKGDWQRAQLLLKDLPLGDKPIDFLREVLAETIDAPPPEWDGVLSVEREGAVRFKTGRTTQVDTTLEP